MTYQKAKVKNTKNFEIKVENNNYFIFYFHKTKKIILQNG